MDYGGCGSRRRTPAVLCAAVVLLALWSPAPAAAATTLKVEAGYAGTYVPGQPLPVRVRVTADRLLSGTLEVATNGAPTSVGVEVPGGSEKEFLVLVSTSAADRDLDVTARLPAGSDSIATGSARVSALADAEVVGLLPGALGGRPVPGPTTLAVDAGTARFVALGPGELDRAPDSLAALRTIGVGGDELARQAPAVRDGLLRWVESGGRLLVDAAPGAGPVPGLPDGWQPGASGRARAGTGEIRLTAGAMAAGRWSGLVEPTARLSDEEARRMGGPPLGDALANDAGFRVAELSWLVAFLAFYVVLVGPGLYVVLRRRRRPELAWAVIPLVAVLFAGVSWAGGRGLRTDTDAVHGTVLLTGAHGSTAVTWLGFSSQSGGSVKLRYPADWVASTSERSVPALTPLRSVRVTSSGPEATLPLDAGQFGMVSARGPSGQSGGLVVTARADRDGRATGTVRNGTDLTLTEVGVLIGYDAVAVGTLDPGEEQDWDLDVRQWNGGPPGEFMLWGPDRISSTGETSFTRISLFDAAKRVGAVDMESGDAVGVGWTDDYRPPVEASGRTARPDGKTMVVGSAPVAASGARTPDVSIRRETVRTTGGLGSLFRFSLPESSRAVDPAKLTLRSSFFPVDVWTGDGWSTVDCTGAACPPGADQFGPKVVCPPGVPCREPPMFGPFGPDAPISDAALPAAAMQDGTVYVRVSSGLPPFLGDAGLALRESV